MPFFLVLSEGPHAGHTRPILALSDERIIGTLLSAIGQMDLADSPADADAAAPTVAAALPCADAQQRVRGKRAWAGRE